MEVALVVVVVVMVAAVALVVVVFCFSFSCIFIWIYKKTTHITVYPVFCVNHVGVESIYIQQCVGGKFPSHSGNTAPFNCFPAVVLQKSSGSTSLIDCLSNIT